MFTVVTHWTVVICLAVQVTIGAQPLYSSGLYDSRPIAYSSASLQSKSHSSMYVTTLLIIIIIVIVVVVAVVVAVVVTVVV